jgi:dTDP-4-amino-4,6-dideoxygalactose transaminase
LGIRSGDKVITTPFTFTATAEVIRYLDADPVFVDVDPVTCNIEPERVSEALTCRSDIRALLPVHFAGQSVDLDPLIELAKRYDLSIVEDAAHALPTTYKGKMIGTVGDVTVFSFYATKTIATGEGGMVTTNRPDLAKRMKTMRLHGISKDVFDRYTSTNASWYYEVVAPGFKYNLTDLAAAIGIHQLKKA